MKPPKFKMTELGPIPEDWEVKRLGEICCKIGSGATPYGGSSSYCDAGVSLIRSQNVLDTTFSFDGLAHINDEQAAELLNVEVEQHDVLLNITGDSVARVCVVPSSILPARVNQHVCILRAVELACSYSFLAYILVFSKERLLLTAFGGGTRNAPTKHDVEHFLISLPPLPEQRRIAGVLSDVDELISALGKLIEKKRNIKTGTM